MKLTITSRLRFTVIGLLILACGQTALLTHEIHTMQEDTKVDVLTYELDELAQRITKYHLFESESASDAFHEKEEELQKMLTNNIQSLREGDTKLGIPKVTNPIVLAKIDALNTLFLQMDSVGEAAEKNPKLNSQVFDLSEKFAETSHELTTIVEKNAADTVGNIRILQLTIFGINVCALAAIWFIVRHVSKTLAGTTQAVAASSSQIASAVEQQERYLADQATSVNETTTTMEELGAASRQAAEQADASAAGAQQALSISENGSMTVSQTIAGINELQKKVEAIAGKIMQLSEQTSQISSITDMVSDIANQTNMLSLNAAVEAARAGEQGKGFAVVAGEVRKLAEQSKKSAERINTLVAEVQSSINSTVMVTDEGTKTAQVGIRMAEDTAKAFNSIAQSINHVYLNSQQIALSAKQQAVAVQQAVSAMNTINLGAQETASGVTQVKSATQNLAATASDLKSIV
jgi:methyl-accepting chemotaxis protein